MKWFKLFLNGWRRSRHKLTHIGEIFRYVVYLGVPVLVYKASQDESFLIWYSNVIGNPFSSSTKSILQMKLRENELMEDRKTVSRVREERVRERIATEESLKAFNHEKVE